MQGSFTSSMTAFQESAPLLALAKTGYGFQTFRFTTLIVFYHTLCAIFLTVAKLFLAPNETDSIIISKHGIWNQQFSFFPEFHLVVPVKLHSQAVSVVRFRILEQRMPSLSTWSRP